MQSWLRLNRDETGSYLKRVRCPLLWTPYPLFAYYAEFIGISLPFSSVLRYLGRDLQTAELGISTISTGFNIL